MSGTSRRILAGGAAAIVVALPAAQTASAAVGATAGGGYAAGVKQAGGEISSSLQSLVKALGLSLHYPVSPTAGRQCAAILARAETRLAAAQKELGTLTPPASARAANAQLLGGTVALERQLRPLIGQLRNGYLVVAAKLLRLSSVRTIQTAASRLKAAGYPTGI